MPVLRPGANRFTLHGLAPGARVDLRIDRLAPTFQ